MSLGPRLLLGAFRPLLSTQCPHLGVRTKAPHLRNDHDCPWTSSLHLLLSQDALLRDKPALGFQGRGSVWAFSPPALSSLRPTALPLVRTMETALRTPHSLPSSPRWAVQRANLLISHKETFLARSLVCLAGSSCCSLQRPGHAQSCVHYAMLFLPFRHRLCTETALLEEVFPGPPC